MKKLLFVVLLTACESKKDRINRLDMDRAIACLDARRLGTTIAQLRCENATEDLKKALR